MIAAELRQELDKENFVSLTIDASNRKEQGRQTAGTLAPWSFIVGVTGAEVPFYRSIISRASFCNFFLQLPKYSKYMQFNVLSCFQGCYIATFCNIFDFCVQLFTAIFFKCCAKCKSVIKKNTKLFQFSSILFDCMKKGYMTD